MKPLSSSAFISVFTIISSGIALAESATTQTTGKPNVVVILADDLGIGDLSCYYKGSKLSTPHIDSLAKDGVRFSDGHSNSAVCTPTRYGLLTGRYCWRTRLKRWVLMGYSPSLIATDRPTIASELKKAGYATACIGKWHLGMNFAKTGKKVDYSKPISNGPNSVGFDYFLGISASLDMAPYALIENNKMKQVPTENFKAVKHPLAYRRGGEIAKEFKHVDYLPQMAKQSAQWIKQQAQTQKPFFLYMPLPSPHKPVLPNKEFQGKSGIGAYGDYVLETDWAVGQVIAQLKQSGVYENTIIVFTSDNGSFATLEKYGAIQSGHKPNAELRGQKTDIYEGGHRVPFIMTWKNGYKAGLESNEVISTTDIMPTVMKSIGASIPQNAAEDGYDFTPLLQGKQTSSPVREATVHHSGAGVFAIRQNQWKLIIGKGSGGRTKVPANSPEIQLYNMMTDPSESSNLYDKHPEVVSRLKKLLKKYQDDGYSVKR